LGNHTVRFIQCIILILIFGSGILLGALRYMINSIFKATMFFDCVIIFVVIFARYRNFWGGFQNIVLPLYYATILSNVSLHVGINDLPN